MYAFWALPCVYFCPFPPPLPFLSSGSNNNAPKKMNHILAPTTSEIRQVMESNLGFKTAGANANVYKSLSPRFSAAPRLRDCRRNVINRGRSEISVASPENMRQRHANPTTTCFPAPPSLAICQKCHANIARRAQLQTSSLRQENDVAQKPESVSAFPPSSLFFLLLLSLGEKQTFYLIHERQFLRLRRGALEENSSSLRAKVLSLS